MKKNSKKMASKKDIKDMKKEIVSEDVKQDKRMMMKAKKRK